MRSLCVGGSGWSGAGDAANCSLLGKVLSFGQSVGELLRSMAPEGAPPPTDEEIAVLDAMMAANDRKALAGVARGMPDIPGLSRDDVAALNVPVLGIAGEHDGERGNLERMEGVAPDFEMIVLDGADRMTALFDERLPRAISDFLGAHAS